MSAAQRRRLDQLLVERGLAESRERARAYILAGYVTVDGQKADKAGQLVRDGSAVEVAARMPYVSRGGYKLAAALDHFGVNPEGRVAIDLGSSTGGFTDVLLQRGAARVHCVDVGAGQLDWKLRNDPRVVVHEGVNARHLKPEEIGEAAGLLVADLSFISVTTVLPAVPPLLRADAELVILIKPQFEVGRGQVGKGGIVRDPELHRHACDTVRKAVEAFGFRTAVRESPITGAEGNREFLLYGHH
ncbi:MAG TPA: TlyA family rRNA (cytidine-2'-O)-methyltransferase [Solibacterales bacterium]|nr:TlyA family rRNA (cytidine-2'-O)-methyltransferase [Bryobacterales bacterium]